MTTEQEKNELFDAMFEAVTEMEEQTSKMKSIEDFDAIAWTAKEIVEKFDKTHPCALTKRLAEAICAYAVIDVTEDAQWQHDAAEWEIEMSSPTYGHYNSHLNYDYAWEWLGPNPHNPTTSFQMIASHGSCDRTVLRETIIW